MKPREGIDPDAAPRVAELLALPLLDPRQRSHVARIAAIPRDEVRWVLCPVDVVCERCGKHVGFAHIVAFGGDEKFVDAEIVLVTTATKQPPGEALVLLGQPHAPYLVPFACRRDGADTLSAVAILSAIQRWNIDARRRRRAWNGKTFGSTAEILRVNRKP